MFVQVIIRLDRGLDDLAAELKAAVEGPKDAIFLDFRKSCKAELEKGNKVKDDASELTVKTG